MASMNRRGAVLAFGIGLMGSLAHAQEGGRSLTSSSSPAAAASSEPEINRELLSVEEQVNTLKERVFRSKATLQLLTEIIAQGTDTGSRGTITHVNGLGRSYKVESISYYLDGQSKYARTAGEGGLDGVREIKIFDGPIQAGTHTLSVSINLKGSGGVFSYVDDIAFNVDASATFEVKAGDTCAIRVDAQDRGGMTRSFVERPSVNFDVRCTRALDGSGAR